MQLKIKDVRVLVSEANEEVNCLKIGPKKLAGEERKNYLF